MSYLLFVALFLPLQVTGNMVNHRPRTKHSLSSLRARDKFLVPFEQDGEVVDADVWPPTNSLRQYVRKQEGKAEVRQQVNGSIPTGYMEIGTPPKKLYAIFDTGSDKLVAKTWSSVAKLINSVDEGVGKLVTPTSEIYCHDTSSSYEGLMEEAIDKNDETGEKKVKVHSTGAIVYGSGEAVTLLGKDTVNVAGLSLSSFDLAEIQADKLRVLHQKDGTSAILGLQHMLDKTRGSSLFTRSREEGQMYSFGYCRDLGNNGTFIWNDHSTEGYSVPVIGDIHWALKMNSLIHEKPDLSASGLYDPGDDAAPVMSIMEQSSSSKIRGWPIQQETNPNQADIPLEDVRRQLPQDISSKWANDWGDAAEEAADGLSDRFRHNRPSSESRTESPQSDWGYDVIPEETADGLRVRFRRKRPSHASSTHSQRKTKTSSEADRKSESDVASTSNSHHKKRGSETSSKSSRRSSTSEDDSSSSHSYDDSSQASSSDDVSSTSSSDGDFWSSLFGSKKKEVPQPHDLCSNAPCAAVIDTGSNIIAGPKAAIEALTKRVNIRHDCGNLATAPHLKIKLGNVLLTVPPSAYVMKVDMPAGGYDFGSAMENDYSYAETESRSEAAQLYARAAVDRLEELGGLSVGLAEPGIYHETDGIPAAKRLSNAAVWRKVFHDLHKEKGIDFRHHFVGVSDSALSGQTICMPAFSSLDANTQHGKLWILGTPVFEKYYTRWDWHKEDERPKVSFLMKSISETCMGSAAKKNQKTTQPVHVATIDARAKMEKERQKNDGGHEHQLEEQQDSHGAWADLARAAKETAEHVKHEINHYFDDSKTVAVDAEAIPRHQLFIDSGARPLGSLLQKDGFEHPEIHRRVNVDDIRYPHWARGLTQI